MDERESKMYAMLKNITPKIGLKNYRSIVSSSSLKKRIEFALVGSYSDKSNREYSIIMHPWTVKRDDIFWARNKIRNFIAPHRTNKLSGQEKGRLKISTFIHVAYKNIYTSALEKRYYYGFLTFSNEMKESWGKVIKWEEYLGAKEKCEFFMPNVSSKEELKDRLEKLLEWVEKNVE